MMQRRPNTLTEGDVRLRGKSEGKCRGGDLVRENVGFRCLKASFNCLILMAATLLLFLHFMISNDNAGYLLVILLIHSE